MRARLAKERRRHVIDQLADDHLFSSAQAVAVYEAPVKLEMDETSDSKS